MRLSLLLLSWSLFTTGTAGVVVVVVVLVGSPLPLSALALSWLLWPTLLAVAAWGAVLASGRRAPGPQSARASLSRSSSSISLPASARGNCSSPRGSHWEWVAVAQVREESSGRARESADADIERQKAMGQIENPEGQSCTEVYLQSST